MVLAGDGSEDVVRRQVGEVEVRWTMVCLTYTLVIRGDEYMERGV